MDNFHTLAWTDLIAALCVPLCLAGFAALFRIGIASKLLWAVLRCTVQLCLLGYVLNFIFEWQTVAYVLGFGVFMTVAAGWTARGRFRRRYRGMTLDLMSVFWIASWLVAGLGLMTGIKPDPWYNPQYLIPLLGMILGNILHGISLGVERFAEDLTQQKAQVETFLSLGASSFEASRHLFTRAVAAGLMPVMNTMLIAGIVSMPGMMTGQILAGVAPMEAVKYQLFIMFLICGATGIGTIGAATIVTLRLFNKNHQLCADRMQVPSS